MFLMITTEEFFRTSWEQYWCLLGISIDFKLELPSTVVPFYKFLANELHWISKKEAYVANTTKLSMTLSLSISYSTFFSFPKKNYGRPNLLKWLFSTVAGLIGKRIWEAYTRDFLEVCVRSTVIRPWNGGTRLEYLQ